MYYVQFLSMFSSIKHFIYQVFPYYKRYLVHCYEICHCLLNMSHIFIQDLFILMGIIYYLILFYLYWYQTFGVLLFWDRVSLCSSNYPGTHSVAQASLELTEIPVFDLPASVSWAVVGSSHCPNFKSWAFMSSSTNKTFGELVNTKWTINNLLVIR